MLLFAGDRDLICNHVGQEALIAGMEWQGEQGLGLVNTLDWKVQGDAVGTWVESRNLTYAKVRVLSSASSASSDEKFNRYSTHHIWLHTMSHT